MRGPLRGKRISHKPAKTQGRRFYYARPGTQGIQSQFVHATKGALGIQPLPNPTGLTPFHLSLQNVVAGTNTINSIQKNKSLLFHTTGDTGGIFQGEYQQITAEAMEADFSDTVGLSNKPAFFYHLGDVVYFTGEASQYYPQFYEPYSHYPAPIFAIPGNHDGQVATGDPPSLTAFVNNFCATEPKPTGDAGDIPRDAMTQPNVYWTLEAPFLTIIGLYSNALENDGAFDSSQIDWFVKELDSAPPEKALIIAVHHPAYSADTQHGGSTEVSQMLDAAFGKSGRTADLVLNGHIHNYQRYTSVTKAGQVPYIVAGAGGYHNLHALQKDPQGNKIEVPFKMPEGVTLENYCDDRFGYLRLQVTPDVISGVYIATAYRHEPSHADVKQIDAFELDWHQHQLIIGGSTAYS
jgi:acid phosphatase type 7